MEKKSRKIQKIYFCGLKVRKSSLYYATESGITPQKK
jgi:hypothetical protein